MDNFYYNGGEGDLLLRLNNYMDNTDAKKFIENIPNLQEFINFEIDSGELLNVTKQELSRQPGMMQLSVPNTNYNINLKATTFYIFALILDINLKLPVATGILTLVGVNSQAIVKLDVQNGEKCIIIEILKKKLKTTDKMLLVHYNSECVNNDIRCRYNKDGKCTITVDQVSMVLESLNKKNVLEKKGDSYKYIY